MVDWIPVAVDRTVTSSGKVWSQTDIGLTPEKLADGPRPSGAPTLPNTWGYLT